MSNKTLIYLTIGVLVGMGLLLVINLLSILPSTQGHPDQYLPVQEVRGSAVVYKDKAYTLNLEQQTELVSLLNQVRPATKKTGMTPPDFQSIIIYRFKKPDLIITPIGYEGNTLLFESPEFGKDTLFEDSSAGRLKSLISTAHD